MYQFTGSANVEVDDVAHPSNPVLVRIELQGPAAGVSTGATQCPTAVYAFPTCAPDVVEKSLALTSGTIIVDGVSYAVDISGMTLRRPDNFTIAGEESSFEGADGITAGGDLEYPGLAIHHYDVSASLTDSEFYHYFRGDGADDDDLTADTGFAAETEFDSDDLPAPLTWGTTYSWRAATMWPVPPTGWVPQEIHDKHETDRLVGVSAVEQFKTVAKAVPPVLTYPVGGLTIYSNTPNLSWNVEGPFAELSFTLWIMVQGGGAACEPTGTVTPIAGIQFDTSNCSVPLVPGSTYEWTITADDGTNTEVSPTETFSIVGAGVAKEAIPSYPVDDLEIYTTAPTFHWYTESDAAGLTFDAFYKERGVGPAATTCGDVQAGGSALPTVSVTQVDVTGLTPGATYDWCVVTTGLNGPVDSGVATFSVAGGRWPVAGGRWPVALVMAFRSLRGRSGIQRVTRSINC